MENNDCSSFKEAKSKDSDGEVPLDNCPSGMEYSFTTDVKNVNNVHTGALEARPSTTLTFKAEDVFTNNIEIN